MTEPSHVLREEHEVIKHLLRVMGAIAQELEHGGGVSQEDLDAILEVVVNFADRCHHAKEEKALFPALRKASPKEGALLVHRLEGDHAAFRQLVAAMDATATAAAEGDPGARARFAKSARTYVGLLQEHIKAETERLLPLTDTALRAPERAALGAEFDRIEREETGAGLHEKYEETIHRLADRYVHAAPHAH